MVEIAEFDAAVRSVVEAVAEWARDWYGKEVLIALEARPDVTARLSEQGSLKTLKMAVGALQKGAWREVEPRIDIPEVWPHLGGDGRLWDRLEFDGIGLVPEKLDAGVRHVLGALGTFLSRAGLIDVGQPGTLWREDDAGIYRIDSDLTWPVAVQEALRNYSALWARHSDDTAAARKRADEAAREEARRLWDEA